MAKKKKTCHKKRIDNEHQIDHIPKCYQQRRSRGGAKPRTDFSLFLCSSSLCNSPLPQDLLLASLSSKEILSSVAIASSDETNDTRMDILDLSLDRYTETESERQELFTNCVEVPVVEVISFDQNAPFGHCSNRNDEERSNSARTLDLTPHKSQITENSDSCITPGNVLWAKTDEQWWPAEALYRKEHLRSCKELFDSPDGPVCLNQHNQSSEKENSSSSSRAGTDYLGRGRSKRERKRKVHFDEVSFPLKARKVRRFRIMRFLGLAAPVGSPF